MSDVNEKAAARDATNWAKKVSTLNVSEVPEGAVAINVEGKRLAGPIQGFGKMWQKTYQVRAAAEQVSADGPDRDVEAALPGVLARGQQLLRAADRDRAGRGRADRHDAAGQDEALDRRDGALRRRGVVHADDAAGAHVRRLDHVQRDRAARRHRGPGAGADARLGPDLRAGADDGRPQAGGPLLGADARPRWRRTSTRRSRTSTPRSSASTRGASGPSGATSGTRRRSARRCTCSARPGARREAAVCLTRSSSARARTAWRRRSRSPAPGRSVRVLEAAETVGGGTRSAELTLPGFVHDVCSAVHPHPLASPFLRDAAAGRARARAGCSPSCRSRTRSTTAPRSRSTRSVDATAASIGGADGERLPQAAWRPLVRDAEKLLPAILGPLRPPRHPLALARFGLLGLRSAKGLARRFEGARAPGAVAGNAAHSMLPPRPPADLRGRARAHAHRPPRRLAGRARRLAGGRRRARLDPALARRRDRVRAAASSASTSSTTPRRAARPHAAAGARDRRRPAAGALPPRARAATATGPASSSSTGRSTARSRGRRRSAAARARCTSAARSRRSRRARRPSTAGSHTERPYVLLAQPTRLRPEPRAGGQAHRLGLLPRPVRLDARHDRTRSRRRSSASPPASATASSPARR